MGERIRACVCVCVCVWQKTRIEIYSVTKPLLSSQHSYSKSTHHPHSRLGNPSQTLQLQHAPGLPLQPGFPPRPDQALAPPVTPAQVPFDLRGALLDPALPLVHKHDALLPPLLPLLVLPPRHLPARKPRPQPRMPIADPPQPLPRPVPRVPRLVRAEHEVDVDPVVGLGVQGLREEGVPHVEDVAEDALRGEGGEVGCEQVGGRVEDGVAEEAEERGLEGHRVHVWGDGVGAGDGGGGGVTVEFG